MGEVGEVVNMGALINVENVNCLLWVMKAALECVVDCWLNNWWWVVKDAGGVVLGLGWLVNKGGWGG